MNVDTATAHLARSRLALAQALASADAEAALDRGKRGSLPNRMTTAAVAALAAAAEAALQPQPLPPAREPHGSASAPAWPRSDSAGVSAALATAHAVLRPLAQQHPWALMAAATLAGAALATGRPWRWLLPPALRRSLVLQLAAAAATAVIQRNPNQPDRPA